MTNRKNDKQVATYLPEHVYKYCDNEARKYGLTLSAFIRMSLIKVVEEERENNNDS